MKSSCAGVVLLLMVVALTQAGDQSATGSLGGVVRFVGTVPAPKKITDSEGGIREIRELLVNEKSRGLCYVAVLLENAPAQPPVKKAKMAIVDQRDMKFDPHVIAVQHGQTVRFENNDLCNHSVMGISTVAENQFNLFAGPNNPIDRVFALQKHPVRIECSLHPWMLCWVYVVPHPWFAVTDPKGEFQIDRIPPGKYRVHFHHADTGRNEIREVQIEAGKTAKIELEWK